MPSGGMDCRVKAGITVTAGIRNYELRNYGITVTGITGITVTVHLIAVYANKLNALSP
jgi:hypothetical protein